MRLALFWAVIGKVRNYHYTPRNNLEERIPIFFESGIGLSARARNFLYTQCWDDRGVEAVTDYLGLARDLIAYVVIFFSVLSLFVDSTNYPFQTKPKSLCSEKSIFPIYCKDF